MTPQQLLAQIKGSGPAAVYLFCGPEMHRRRLCRKMLIEKFLPEDQREEGFTRHDLEEIPLRDVIDDAGSYSLFSPRRVLWASGAEGALPRGSASDAGNPDAAALAAYVKNPTPDVVLVLDAQRFGFDGEDKARMERLRKFYAAIPNQVEFAPYTAVEARQLAGELAQRQRLQIGPLELEVLVEALGNDASRIANEIEKLSLFTGGQRAVTAEDIAALTPDARATTIFALVHALGRRDRSTSLDLLQMLVREGEYLPLALTFLATQFRFALAAKEEGLRSPQQIQGHFSRLGVPMWPSRAQQVFQTLSAFGRPQLEQALTRIYQADKGLRDRNPDDRIVMEDLVLALTR
ncbi:MAG: DNA polymerase III subunit delta [Acidobacteria bacterium]|nr:DNA polymerase III subunit delta [Acidobacteriota bacterium]